MGAFYLRNLKEDYGFFLNRPVNLFQQFLKKLAIALPLSTKKSFVFCQLNLLNGFLTQLPKVLPLSTKKSFVFCQLKLLYAFLTHLPIALPFQIPTPIVV